MNVVSIISLVFLLSGCRLRIGYSPTINANELCMKGVLYYQFRYGTSVALDKDGKVLTCEIKSGGESR